MSNCNEFACRIPLLLKEGWLRQSIKWREATELGADGVVPLERPATNSFGTTPPARPFLEFDGLAGTPPNSGGEFQTRNCQLLHTFGVVAHTKCFAGLATPPARGGEHLRLDSFP